MITVITKLHGGQQSHHPDGVCPRKEYYGLSADAKPVANVNNADVFYEMDTMAVFLFDATNSVWLEQQ